MSKSPERFPISDAREAHVVLASGLRLRTLHRGPENADSPVFLLIHGLASNSRMWDGVGRALAARRYRSIAVDLRGHGRSDKPDNGYDFDTVSQDLCELLDALAIDQAIFVGQSWGGNIVVHAAHQHPDRVIAAVPVDGGFIELGD